MSQRPKRNRQPIYASQGEEYEFEPHAGSSSQASSQRASARPPVTFNNRGHEEDEDNDEPGYSQAGATQPSQARAAVVRLPAEERERLISDVMRFILARDVQKLTFKREDIRKFVLPDCKQRGVASGLLEEARVRLRDLMGFELVEVAKTSRRRTVGAGESSSSAAGGNNVYVLKNTRSIAETYEGLDRAADADNRSALLLVVCALVFLTDGQLRESDMWRQLGDLGLERGTKTSAAFGSPRIEDVLDEFCKQQYLSKVKSEEQVLWSMGPRADAEISEKSICAFILEMYGDEVNDENIAALRHSVSAFNAA